MIESGDLSAWRNLLCEGINGRLMTGWEKKMKIWEAGIHEYQVNWTSIFGAWFKRVLLITWEGWGHVSDLSGAGNELNCERCGLLWKESWSLCYFVPMAELDKDGTIVVLSNGQCEKQPSFLVGSCVCWGTPFCIYHKLLAWDNIVRQIISRSYLELWRRENTE